MQKEQITEIFDHQAATYDQKWSWLEPINSALHLLASSVLAELPATARILCVGAVTRVKMPGIECESPAREKAREWLLRVTSSR